MNEQLRSGETAREMQMVSRKRVQMVWGLK